MVRFAQHQLSGTKIIWPAAAVLALAACGGGSAAPPAGGVPASSPPLRSSGSTVAASASGAVGLATPAAAASRASASAAAGASPAGSTGAGAKPGASGASAGGASASAKPAAAASGQTAPGPYKQNGSTTAAGGQAAIQATDSLQWQPNTIMAKPGDKITLTISNPGNTLHSFTGPSLGVANGQDIAAGKSTAVTFTVPNQPGVYQFWCNIPGHAQAGMVGEVIAQ